MGRRYEGPHGGAAAPEIMRLRALRAERDQVRVQKDGSPASAGKTKAKRKAEKAGRRAARKGGKR